MKLKNLFLVAMIFVLLGAFAFSAIAGQLPATINKVKINGVELSADSTNRLDVEKGERIDVSVELTATGAAPNTEVEAFISGYEYNEFEPLADTTDVFDMESGVTYLKKLKFTLPTNVEKDDYKLRIIVSDRYDTSIVQDYNLKISPTRHALEIRDITFSRSYEVGAGTSIYATVRLRNNGQKDEENIKVTVTIPALGIEVGHYIDELESDESTTTEELELRIPATAASGTYAVKAIVRYNDGYDSVSEETSLKITAAAGAAVQTEPVINANVQTQDLVVGQGAAVYPITIQNKDSVSKSFAITVEGADNFAEYRVTPSNILTVASGETQTAYVYLAAKPGAADGLRTFVVNVQSGSNVKQFALKANVLKAQSTASWPGLVKALEYLFVTLVVLLLILGIILLVVKTGSKPKRKESPETREYY